jgi:hypothetical protein
MTPGALRAFSSWNSMLQRCFDQSRPGWQGYGRRGITVCERWLDPWVFLEDMGERPEGLSLGRIDNDGIYEPSNCRWETPTQQNRNTRRTVLIGGKAQSEVAEASGLSDATISRRRRSGAVVDAPKYFKRNKLNTDQVAKIKSLFLTDLSNVAIAAQFGVTHSLIRYIRRGDLWPEIQSAVAHA